MADTRNTLQSRIRTRRVSGSWPRPTSAITRRQTAISRICLCFYSREVRQVGRRNPAGAVHMDVRRFRRRRMRLTEIPGPLANPTASSLGAPQGGFLLVTFLCRSKKSDSRAVRNALLLNKSKKAKSLGPRLRGDDEQKQRQKHPSSILPCAARKGGGLEQDQAGSQHSLRWQIRGFRIPVKDSSVPATTNCRTTTPRSAPSRC